MSAEKIYFDSDSPELKSDLRILVTIKSDADGELTIYRDSNGTRKNVERASYVSDSKTPRVIKQDDISIATNWPKKGGPNVVLLPEGQRLLLGELPDGFSVDISLWRTFIMAQTFTNRILVRRTAAGVQAFAPKPGSNPSAISPSIYKDATQQRDVQKILDSIEEKAAVVITAPLVSTQSAPSFTPKEVDPAEKLPEPTVDVELESESNLGMDLVEFLPALELQVENNVEEIATEGKTAEISDEKNLLQSQREKIFSVISDILMTFAILAVLYAGYQTVWTGLMSQRSTDKAVAELEVQWIEDPTIKPVLHKGFALIYIPRLQDKVWGLPITHGVEAEDLHAGLGHYIQTPLPGEEGNFAIAGHRSTYGEPLANIDQLQQDDEIIIRTGTNWYTYKLIMTAIVEPDEMWTIEENPGGLVNATGVKEMITITTCDPRWGSTHRWVWWGTLAEASPVEEVPEVIGTVQ